MLARGMGMGRRIRVEVALGAVLALAVIARAQSSETRRTYAGEQVVRIEVEDKADFDRFIGITKYGTDQDPGDWDVWTHELGKGPIDIHVTAGQVEQLKAGGFDPQVWINDLGPLVAENYARTPLAADFFLDYHPIPEIFALMDQYKADYPSLVKIVNLGNSLEGRQLRAMVLTSPNGPPNKPGVFFHGGQHAREWINVPVPVYVADWLLKNYGTHPKATRLLDQVEWTILPVMNPDGYDYTWTSERLWRKNRRPPMGVDLNRNWGYQWGGEGSSGSTNSETYRGPSPFSEPETQATSKYVTDHPNILAYCDYHSYSQLVMYPWGYTAAFPPDHAEFLSVTGQMAALIKAKHGMTYQFGPVYTTIYPASGVSVDWVYGQNKPQRTILATTIELRDTGQFGFLLPKEQIIPTCEENLDAALMMGDWVSLPLNLSINQAPKQAEPGEAGHVEATVTPRGAQFGGDISVFYRYGNSGAFTEKVMTNVGGNRYAGDIPGGSCGQDVQWYVEATATNGSSVTQPDGAPGTTFSYPIGVLTVVFSDDFQTDKGWTVTNQAVTDGAWARGVPAGGGTRGDPPTDFDGSGQCFTTGLGVNQDLDGGPTIVTSATFDLSSGSNYAIAYAYWFTNDDGDADRLTVDISNNNGASWVSVKSYTSAGGWTQDSFIVDDFVTPTSQVRVRFSAADNPNNSVTEAGLDAFSVSSLGCPGGAIPCSDVKNLSAKCKSGTVKGKVKLTNGSHSGKTVTVSVGGNNVTATVNGKVAKFSDGGHAGTVTVDLIDPPGCVSPKQVTCN